jgi:hypothetical protein
VSTSDVPALPVGGGDIIRRPETYSRARCVGEGIRRGRSEVTIDESTGGCSRNGSPPLAASNSFISASKRAMDDIGWSLSNLEAGELAKNRSRIVSRRPGTDPTGPEPLTGLFEPLTGAEPVRDLGQDDGWSLVADSGRRCSLASRGDPIFSETVLTMLNRSSESKLDILLFFERIDGLSNAVLGSPLIKNNDDGEGTGVS